MKRIMLIIIASFFFVTGCNDDFVNTKPLTEVPAEDVWKDVGFATAFVTELYGGLGVGGFNEQMLASLTDESLFTHPGRGINTVTEARSNPADRGWINSTLDWAPMYQRIRACNIALESLEEPQFENTGGIVEQLKGEAHFMRAYYYHQLLRYFGGVPIVEKVYGLNETDYTVSRNTFEECVNFIVAECDEAANLLNGKNMASGRASSAAALALKSRVLLYAASDLHDMPTATANSATLASFEEPAIIGYTSGDRTERWQRAKDAAKAVVDLTDFGYALNLETPASPEEGENNYMNIALAKLGGENELIFARYFIDAKTEDGGWVGRNNGPNGYHNWAGNTPIQNLVDDYEMLDGSTFDWENPVHAASPYENRDPRLDATVLHDASDWKPRVGSGLGKDPANQIQTGQYEIISEGSKVPYFGLDTRKSSVEDWNGSHTGYYMRKFIDPNPAITDMNTRQQIPWPFLRYTEAVLNYVEACIALGEDDEAKDWLNKIRFRAGMPEITETGNALRERYRNERRVELAYEEHRYHDARRWMIAPETLGQKARIIHITATLKPGKEVTMYKYDKENYDYVYTPSEINPGIENRQWLDKMYYLPIERDEINRNDKLLQNPGYDKNTLNQLPVHRLVKAGELNNRKILNTLNLDPLISFRSNYTLLVLGVFLFCCQSDDKTVATISDENASPRFTLLPQDATNVTFSNTLTEGLNTNVLMYEYFYNGGGVAVGDVNNDGYDDLYFTSNMESNALYLNKGNMQFEEVTGEAGVSGRSGPWKTGVTMVDINGDGRMDIYVCYSGNVHPEKRTNQLFINQGPDTNGIPRFKEEAAKFGLDLSSATTQTYFFDYDKDGDLDAFVLNHNIKALPELNEQGTAVLIKQQDAFSGIRLLKNTKDFFEDVTVQCNLSSSALTYGLGAGIADLNNDGWTDIYVSNDYNVPDYLYINNGDGTFTDQLAKGMGHTSHFSMGNDVADVNNDALPDVYTLDMLPEDNARQKLLLAPDNYAKFELNVRIGFHYQYMRNMLQLNNGNGTFSEIGQLAGISNTDWSWAPLLADYDNDGWKDLFVTNGYLRDYTNLDFIKYMDNFVRQKGRLKREDVLDLVHRIPASNVVNYIFQNTGGYTFKNVTHTWGIDQPSNSNGAAYSDLDNDGDLDLVVNNINEPAFIYRNESSDQLINHFLRIKLEGVGKNTSGLGAKITVYSKGTKQYFEQMPARGYQSSVSPVLHVGLGEHAIIDSVCIDWLTGRRSLYRAVSADQLIIVKEEEAKMAESLKLKDRVLAHETKPPFEFVHQKIKFNDFKRQPLLISPMSFSGPCMVKADVNGDGLEDVFIGGGKGQPGAVFMQQANGNFIHRSQPDFEFHKFSDDTDAAFFDANADGFTDLYVCSGGYHDYMPDDSQLQDRLYINDGRGNFHITNDALPAMNTSTACVRAVDLNKDGHMDIFVGGRVVPGRYPEKPRSYLLVNNGKGQYVDMTQQLAPSLEYIGMVTDARWLDLNNDSHEDLVLVGEWMRVTVLLYESETFHDKTLDYFDREYTGWWNTIHVNDFNHDGRADLVIGNHGLNSQCKVSDAEPGELFYKDFDNNGSVDPIFCLYIQGKSFPYISRDEMMEQLGMMRQRFPDYKSYSDATLNTIFKPAELSDVGYSKINTLQTVYFQRDKKGRFEEKVLPIVAQVSPAYAITSLDYDMDGHIDLLLCGNTTHSRIRFGKYDANLGILLKGDGKGGFLSIPNYKSGFNLHGDVKSILHLNGKLVFGINQQGIKSYAFDQIR